MVRAVGLELWLQVNRLESREFEVLDYRCHEKEFLLEHLSDYDSINLLDLLLVA